MHASAIREALEAQRRATKWIARNDRNEVTTALAECCASLIALASQQQERIDSLAARVRDLTAEGRGKGG